MVLLMGIDLTQFGEQPVCAHVFRCGWYEVLLACLQTPTLNLACLSCLCLTGQVTGYNSSVSGCWKRLASSKGSLRRYVASHPYLVFSRYASPLKLCSAPPPSLHPHPPVLSVLDGSSHRPFQPTLV